jgi:hypothetical protein
MSAVLGTTTSFRIARLSGFNRGNATLADVTDGNGREERKMDDDRVRLRWNVVMAKRHAEVH